MEFLKPIPKQIPKVRISFALNKADCTCNVFHTTDFSIFNRDLVLVKEGVLVEALAEVLQDVCKLFYNQLNNKGRKENTVKVKVLEPSVYLFQCKTCFTIYNEVIGDVVTGIPAGTPFETLSDDYCCPLCEGPKTGYEKIVDVL